MEYTMTENIVSHNSWDYRPWTATFILMFLASCTYIVVVTKAGIQRLQEFKGNLREGRIKYNERRLTVYTMNKIIIRKITFKIFEKK